MHWVLLASTKTGGHPGQSTEILVLRPLPVSTLGPFHCAHCSWSSGPSVPSVEQWRLRSAHPAEDLPPPTTSTVSRRRSSREHILPQQARRHSRTPTPTTPQVKSAQTSRQQATPGNVRLRKTRFLPIISTPHGE